MRSGLLIASLFLMILLSPLITRSFAVGGGWFTHYVVRDLQTEATVKEIFEGAEYNITLRINVTTTAPATLKLYTSLNESMLIDRYWDLHSRDYPGINLSAWRERPPNQNYVEFSQKIGVLEVSCYGKIPDDITIKHYGEITLHKAINWSVVELKDASNTTLDRINLTVIDSEIKSYETLLSDKKHIVAEMRNKTVAAKYIQLSEDIIDKAEEEANEGFVDKAKSLLNMIPSSDWPIEPSPSFMETMFMPVVGVLSAALILLAVLFIKSKAQISYVLKVIEDQIKDLEGLTVKASRVDKSISARIERVKDRLKSLVGV